MTIYNSNFTQKSSKLLQRKICEVLCLTWVIFHDTEGDAKFEEKLTWKMTGIWQIFTRAIESLRIGILMGSQNPQRSYVSWKWRMIQNLKRNWLVISKLAWGIWWILTWALESLTNFHFNVLLLRKVYIVWAKTYRGVIFHETE